MEGMEHTQEIRDMRTQIANDPSAPAALKNGRYFCWGGSAEGFITLDNLIAQQPTQLLRPPPADRNAKDVLFYIYTRYCNCCCAESISGTTGLPKASIIRHLRAYMGGLAFSGDLE